MKKYFTLFLVYCLVPSMTFAGKRKLEGKSRSESSRAEKRQKIERRQGDEMEIDEDHASLDGHHSHLLMIEDQKNREEVIQSKKRAENHYLQYFKAMLLGQKNLEKNLVREELRKTFPKGALEEVFYMGFPEEIFKFLDRSSQFKLFALSKDFLSDEVKDQILKAVSLNSYENHVKLNFKSVSQFREFIHSPYLSLIQGVRLSFDENCTPTIEDFRFFFQNAVQLKVLDLSNNSILDDEVLFQILLSSRHSHLIYLNLSNSGLQSGLLKDLVGRLPQTLLGLDLSQNNLDGESSGNFLNALPKNLVALNLSYNDYEDDDVVQWIDKLPKSVTHLSLGFNYFNSIAAARVLEEFKNREFDFLNLEGSMYPDDIEMNPQDRPAFELAQRIIRELEQRHPNRIIFW